MCRPTTNQPTEVATEIPKGFEGFEAGTATGAVGAVITCLGRLCASVGQKSAALQSLSFFMLVRVAALWDVVSDVIVAWELWKDGATVAFQLCVAFLVLPVLLMTLGILPGKIMQARRSLGRLE